MKCTPNVGYKLIFGGASLLLSNVKYDVNYPATT